jgi:hypothetical protein
MLKMLQQAAVWPFDQIKGGENMGRFPVSIRLLASPVLLGSSLGSAKLISCLEPHRPVAIKAKGGK